MAERAHPRRPGRRGWARAPGSCRSARRAPGRTPAARWSPTRSRRCAELGVDGADFRARALAAELVAERRPGGHRDPGAPGRCGGAAPAGRGPHLHAARAGPARRAGRPGRAAGRGRRGARRGRWCARSLPARGSVPPADPARTTCATRTARPSRPSRGCARAGPHGAARSRWTCSPARAGLGRSGRARLGSEPTTLQPLRGRMTFYGPDFDALPTQDPEIAGVVVDELQRLRSGLQLIASENFTSPGGAGRARLDAVQQVRRGLPRAAVLRRLRGRRPRRDRSASSGPRRCSAPSTPTCSRTAAPAPTSRCTGRS